MKRPTIIIGIRNGKVAGCILNRGPAGFESFDTCDRSLGLFPTAEAANNALQDPA